MKYIIDLIILAIIIIFVITSAKKGFVRVAVSTVGFVLAIIIAFNLSNPLSQVTYDKLIEPPVVKGITSELDNETENIADSTWEALPDFIKNNPKIFSITEENFKEKFGEHSFASNTMAVINFSQNTIKPVLVKVMSMIYSVLLTLILLVIVGFLSKFINKLFSFSVVGKLNRTLGGLLGVIKGLVVALIFCGIISIIISINQKGFLIFTPENIDKTILFKNIVKLIPFSI